MSDRVDLGSDHSYRLFVWAPDLELNPQYADLPGSSDDPVGAIIDHRRSDGSICSGAIHFDTPRTRRMSETNLWTLHSLDPLHVEPSVLCKTCGDHGFVREGKWVVA